MNNLSLFLLVINALRDVRVLVPSAVRKHDNVLLNCFYDMEEDSLYSVKWYKGRREFYRYTPKEKPPMQIFPIVGATVIVSIYTFIVFTIIPRNLKNLFDFQKLKSYSSTSHKKFSPNLHIFQMFLSTKWAQNSGFFYSDSTFFYGVVHFLFAYNNNCLEFLR